MNDDFSNTYAILNNNEETLTDVIEQQTRKIPLEKWKSDSFMRKKYLKGNL